MKHSKEKSSLAITHPELVKEWHPTKNGDLTPYDVTAGSSKKIWWKCEKGHEWQATIGNRAYGKSGCPYCLNKKVKAGYNDLATTHPELAKEWHPIKNEELSPQDVTAGSRKRVWWMCEKGHEWQAAVSSRGVKKQGCPYCSGRKAIMGENDFATLFPQLAKEWHPTKNGELSPQDFKPGSHRKIWWQCDKGHEWQATIEQRAVKKQGCPYCHPSTSFPEQAIFYYIKKAYPDARSRHKVYGLEFDVFIPSINVGIEYDGFHWHNDRLDSDNKKDLVCAKGGIRLIRVREKGLQETDSAFIIVRSDGITDESLHQSIAELFDYLSVRGITVQIDNDRTDIYSNYAETINDNSLGSLFPEIAAEWHPSKNGNLTPQDVAYGSGRKVWWLCDKGHEWQASIASRTNSKTGCPYCSNFKAKAGFNDLATTHPEIAREWHPSKNGNLTPQDITAGSAKKVWWKCEKGHEWQAIVASRTNGGRGDKGVGCPFCSNQRTITGENDLATTHPEIAREWHPAKNGELSPEIVTAGSNKKVWWMCDKGHEWQATIANRTKHNTGCPYCTNKKVKAGYNDLATTHPEIAREWHPTKNGELSPENVTAGSNKKVWWKCPECGHEWPKTVNARKKGSGCPNCNYRWKLSKNNQR